MTVPGPGLTVHRVDAAAMAERAVALLTERLQAGAEHTDIAVLARVGSALLPVQVALAEAGIAHTAPLDATVLGRTGVRTALAYLRIGLDVERIRREDLFDTINRPARKVKSAVQPLLGRRPRFSIDQLDQLADSLADTHRERFRAYLGDLRGLEAAVTDGADTARCLWIVRNRIGLGDAMDALDASRTRPEGSSHGDDLDALEQLATLRPDPSSFRDWLVERLRIPGDRSGVTLSTVHRVKGMEWPHVVVFAANQGLFPHRLAEDVEEERRVFHVAITRCQEQVDVIADRERTSPFVTELTDAADRPVTRTDAATAATAARASTALPAPIVAEPRDDGSVIAARGLPVEVVGGFTGIVTSVRRDHAEVTIVGPDSGQTVTNAALLRVPFGQRVLVDGRDAILSAPPLRRASRRPTADGPRDSRVGGQVDGNDGGGPVDEALFEALRHWRARIAAEQGMPAYLVFHDRHLQMIAGRRPGTLRELAGCPGVGPTKLDRYGDDILDLVTTHGG